MLIPFNSQKILMIGWLALALTARTSHSQSSNAATPPQPTTQTGDEIIVCGERFHIGTPVVLWADQGGYDFHYSRPPGAPDERKANRVRMSPLTDAQIAQIRRDGWTP